MSLQNSKGKESSDSNGEENALATQQPSEAIDREIRGVLSKNSRSKQEALYEKRLLRIEELKKLEALELADWEAKKLKFQQEKKELNEEMIAYQKNKTKEM